MDSNYYPKATILQIYIPNSRNLRPKITTKSCSPKWLFPKTTPQN